MRREDVDFHAVWDEHIAIHERLWNWARYVSGGGHKAACSPMFRMYRSEDTWRHNVIGDPIDSLDGHQIEKAVSRLPEKNRDALRWVYVFYRISPGKMQRHLGVTKTGLVTLIHDARSMLKHHI